MVTNNMMSFSKGITEQMEARSKVNENIRKEWLTSKAK
jgi:hypothetical protein